MEEEEVVDEGGSVHKGSARGLLRVVTLHMVVEGAALCPGFPTVRALVRLFARMSAHMLGQVALLLEAVAAFITHVWLGLSGNMLCFNMSSELLERYELSIATTKATIGGT